MPSAVSEHPYLVGIDSDGCVFDSMEVKQRDHFHPLILRHWRLEALETELRATAEYVNLRSPRRGSNRFIALHRTFELLHAWPGLADRGVPLPDPAPLDAWIAEGGILDNTTLAARAAETGDSELRRTLDWSLAVNADIQATMAPIPPFDGAREALAALHAVAETVVVSLTPRGALEHEWTLHGIRPFADAVAGQESGSKTRQLQEAMAAGGYPPERVLLIGDAPGDLQAARECGVGFFPTIPGQEAACWRELVATDLALFLQGRYRGEREDTHVAAFTGALSDIPPWA